MKRSRREKRQDEPALDPRVVAVAVPRRGGMRYEAFRCDGRAVEPLAAADLDDAAQAVRWPAAQRAARTLVVLAGADVIVRAVQLPAADDARLDGALRLNASTFVLGRTPHWRVVSTMLPRERGDRIRTGIVAEWPEDSSAPAMPPGLGQPGELAYAPAVAALVALAGNAQGPLVWVDGAESVLSIAVPTTRGLLVRTVRAGEAGEAVPAAEVARAVGEACVHAGVPGTEIPAAIASAGAAAEGVLAGGLGFLPGDLPGIRAFAPRAPADAPWWREHGLAVGVAVAASGSLRELASLADTDPNQRPDRAAALVARIAEPRTARRLVVAGLLAVLLGPMAIEGIRLLVLRWKMPDLAAYLKAEDEDRRRQAMYRSLSAQAASMTKTLSDIACCAPDGVEIGFINVSPGARGQAVAIRGRTRGAGAMTATEILMEMERQLRESGAFDSIQRSSEAPDASGYQAFSLGAVAVRPTYLVAFPEAQDYATKSMRERRYGPPPEDVDPVASGLEPGGPARGTDKPAGDDRPGTPAKQPTGSAPVAPAATTVAAASPEPEPEPRAQPTPVRETKAREQSPEDVDATASKEGAGGADDRASESSEERRSGSARPTREGSGARSKLATRANPGAAAEAEPVPPPLSENEINKMSPEEQQQALAAIARARNRADIDDETKARLKSEFNLLLDVRRKGKQQ